MAGGQSGQSWLGENNIWIAGLVAAVMLLLGFGPRACDGGPSESPVEKHETACEQAWTDNEAGKADDEAQTLLATSFCQQHNQVAIAEAQMEQQQELQEAQTP